MALPFFLVVSCAQSPIKRYNALLDSHVGASNKRTVATLLGAPKSCERKEATERCEIADGKNVCEKKEAVETCEFHTAKGQNGPRPSVYRPQPGFGPDLSPYENMDVLTLTFDNEGILRGWEPVFLQPH